MERFVTFVRERWLPILAVLVVLIAGIVVAAVSSGGDSSSSTTDAQNQVTTQIPLPTHIPTTKSKTKRHQRQATRKVRHHLNKAQRKAKAKNRQLNRSNFSQTAHGVAGKPKTFSGKGPTELGSLVLKHKSTLSWTSAAKNIEIVSPAQIYVLSKKPSGKTVLYKGVIEDFRVLSDGAWTVTITPR